MVDKKSYQELKREELISQLKDRDKELSCIYRISHLVEQEEKLSGILQGTANILSESWRYPDITCVKIKLNNKEYKTENYKETEWIQRSGLLVKEKKSGYIEIGYLKEKPEDDEGPFLKEERSLLDAVAERLGRIIERKQATRDLQLNKERLQLALHGAQLGLWDWNIKTDEVHFNGRWAEMLGYSLDEIKLELDTWKKLTHPEDLKIAQDKLEDHFNGKTDYYESEMRMKHKTGKWIWILDTGKVIERDQEGKPIRACGIHLDITDRKEKDKELQKRTESLRTTLNSIGDAVISTDLDGNIVRINPIAQELTGWNQDKALGQPINKVFNIVNAKTRETVENPVDNVLEEDKIVGLANHTVLISKDGKEYQIADSGAPIKDDDGNITGVVLVFRDVTEKYKIRQKMKDSKDLLESTMNAIPDAIGVLDSEFNVIRYNNAGYNLLNKSPEEVKGRKCYQLIGRNEPCKKCAIQKSLHSKKIEQVERYEEDLDIWVNLRAYPILNHQGEITKIIEHFQDITKYKNLAEELRNKEKDLRTTLNSIGDAVISTDLDGNIVRMNPIAEELTGWDEKEVLGKPINQVFQIVNAKTSKEVPNPVDKVLEQEKIVGLANHTVLISKDGKEYQIADSAAPIKDDDGNITGVVLVFRDITDTYKKQMRIKQHAKELQDYKNRLESTMKIGNLAWWEMDINTGEVKFNQKKAEMLGYDPEKFSHYQDFMDLVHPHDYDRAMQVMRDHFQGKKSIYKVDYRIETKNGDYKWFHDIGGITSTDTKDKPKKVTGVVVDITKRKKAEQAKSQLNTALKHKNKELKQILYATSHDLRTPLVNIKGFNQELKQALKELERILKSSEVSNHIKEKIEYIIDEEIPESMHFISSSASKMDNMLSGLLSLSRLGQTRLNIKKLDVDQIIDEVISNFEYEIKNKDVDLEINELPDCVGDQSQINQVFTNLISNALKYLEPDRPGKITISGQKDNQWSNYSVKDNGVGIPEDQQKKIFNLFHQSDPKSSGIGLGLNIIKQIIDRHNGNITVESQKCQGTKFTISLPNKRINYE